MRLRKLEEKDSELMLEWMHDENVVEWLNADFASKTMGDCKNFIENSRINSSDMHMAVVDEMDCYMGTVSLKHIDLKEKNAEFAITVRKTAMGKGFSRYAMDEIIRIGFQELGLKEIYWCVSVKNERAVRFYEKGLGKRTQQIPQSILSKYKEETLEDLIWYVVSA